MASRLPADPRLHDGTSTYDRNQITHLLTTYYQFLSTLPLIEAHDIVYPPPTGWINLANSTLPFLRKSDEVITLLQHLPYIRKNRGEAPYPISPDTFCLDYSSEDLQVPAKINSHQALMSVTKSIPEWVVPLTYPEDSNAGVWWLLDTSDGTVTDWGRHGFESDHDYAEDDPHSWRNECDRTLRLEELLEEWKEKFESLEWIAFWGYGWVHMWYWTPPKQWTNGEPSEEVRECLEMQKIIRDHGWPDDFKRNECKQALLEWEKGTRQRRIFQRSTSGSNVTTFM